MRGAVCVVLLAGASGCGLSLQGLAADGDAGPGADGAAALDAGAPGLEGGPGIDGAAFCSSGPPAGWSFVVYETGRAPCPSGYGAAHDESADPMLSAGACGCTCDVTTPASCETGTLQTQFSRTPPGPSSAACPTAGESVVVSGSGCTPLPAVGQLQGGFSAGALPFTAGTCTGTIAPDTSKLSTSQVRFCDVPASPPDSVCAGAAPAGFSACIVSDGLAACPPGPFAHPIALADGDELVCPPCDTCALTGSCSGAQVELFADLQCQVASTTLACNGQCLATTPGIGAVASALEYSATVQSTCAAGSSGTATVTPSGPHALCCF